MGIRGKFLSVPKNDALQIFFFRTEAPLAAKREEVKLEETLPAMTSNFPLSYAPFMKQRVGSTILDLVYFCSPFLNYSNFSSLYGGKLEVL